MVTTVLVEVATMTEPERGNMRPCGCHRGRPCTCEMGKRSTGFAYACGECINCQLNARAVQKHRKPVRKCVLYDAFVAEQQLDRFEIAPGCILRMRKPDWDTSAKSTFYTQMRQFRLGLVALRVHSAATIERQMKLRIKYNRDLQKTQEALQRVEATRHTPALARQMSADVTHVDSDVFDSYSKQLIPAETLLPDLLARLEAVNEIIATEERNLVLVETHVTDVAVRKLQATVRAYQGAQRWKRIWWRFREDAEWAAAVVIQSVFRMAKCRPVLPFLRELQREKAKLQAADRLHRFFRRLCVVRRIQDKQRLHEALAKARAQKSQAAAQLLLVFGKIICRLAIWKWRERSREATAHDERRVIAAVVRIQSHWRGLRERLSYHRIRYRRLLSDPVRALYDRFVCHGDLWRLLFEVDAAFQRYEHREQEEQQDAKTFMSELVRDKREYEEKMMQAWFTASALDSPIVRAAESMVSSFSRKTDKPEGFPLAEAILQSPMAKDLVAMSPGKEKSDIFPDDLPAEVIRRATYEGFTISETVAVMRGLIAQGKAVDNHKSVLRVLKSRAPLTIRPWKLGRVVLNEQRVNSHLPDASMKHKTKKTKLLKTRPLPSTNIQSFFLTANMIDNIPGGLMGTVERLLLVAGLMCFDPDAPHCNGHGGFVFRLEASRDPWRSYLEAASPLTKIRREQVVQDAVEPYVAKLKENRCFTAFDILHNIRGIDELVSWGIPRPLVMAIYDVIELVHQQSVNRSDRNLKRQIRVSAQFEAFVERQQRHHHENRTVFPALSIEVPQPDGNTNSALHEIATALERDVLDLPLRPNATIGDVLFKAHFLLCGADMLPGNTTNQQIQSDLSPSNYKQFLAAVVAAQLIGDGDCVKQLVQTRLEIASRLGLACETLLKKLKISSAADLKGFLVEGNEISLHDALCSMLKHLLQPIPEVECCTIPTPGIRAKRCKPQRRQLGSLSPLIRQSKTIVDTLDDVVCGFNIPS